VSTLAWPTRSITAPRRSSLTRRTRTRRSASPASPARRHPAPRSENTLAGKKLTFVDPEKVANNARVNDTVFQFLSIVSGIVCGILGYTDLKGLGAFFVFNCVIGAGGVRETERRRQEPLPVVGQDLRRRSQRQRGDIHPLLDALL
jgi:hypothetical protein